MRFFKMFYISAGFFLACFMPSFYGYPVISGPEEKLFYPALVKKFYLQTQNKIFWFGQSPEKRELKKELMNCIDSAFSYDLISERYHYNQLQENIDNVPGDSLSLFESDKMFTDAAIGWMKNVYEGYLMSPWVAFDQVSSKYENESDQFLLNCLSNIHSAAELKKLMDVLQPQEKEYQFLKQELKLQKHNNDREKIRQLTLSLSYFRWIHHFRIEKATIVNIGSAYLRYYENDSLVLLMKVVVGKPATPTPRFAAWCDQVILYPYWYVPRKIALNEYVNRFKRNPGLIDAMNMQVIDDNGRVLNHYKLNWSAFSKNYFPYTVRQSTGCDNALGVIKFNLTSPYGVYLHDTNVKTAFFSGYRYYSHGCIRIEEPIELGNRLLNNTLDTTFLQSCFKEQKPIPIQLEEPVPVFVVYMPVEASNSGKISYYKDVYKLLK